MRRASAGTPFVGLDELASASSKDGSWDGGDGSGSGATGVAGARAAPTGLLRHARASAASGTGGTGDTAPTAFSRRASTGAVTPSGEPVSPLRGRRYGQLPRLRPGGSGDGGRMSGDGERKRSRSVTVLPSLGAGRHATSPVRHLAARPSWVAATSGGSGDAKATPAQHTLSRRLSSQGVHRGVPVTPSVGSSPSPEAHRLKETVSWCDQKIDGPEPRVSAAGTVASGASGGRGKRRRSSTIVVSKASTDAAKKLANKWGGAKSIQAKLSSAHKRPSCILSPGCVPRSTNALRARLCLCQVLPPPPPHCPAFFATPGLVSCESGTP